MTTRPEQKCQGLFQPGAEGIRRPVIDPTTITASLHHPRLAKLREMV
jgi:hypothetical protein